MAEATTLYICPECGCPDLMIQRSALALEAKDRKAQCPNCSWAGTLAEAAGIATTEKIYDTKAILDLLLYTVTKHAAGPISQALIFVGLLEKDDQVGIDKVMRAATEGVIEKAFMAAAEHAATKNNLAAVEKLTIHEQEPMDLLNKHIIKADSIFMDQGMVQEPDVDALTAGLMLKYEDDKEEP